MDVGFWASKRLRHERPTGGGVPPRDARRPAKPEAARARAASPAPAVLGGGDRPAPGAAGRRGAGARTEVFELRALAGT
jgi:hypothetical protein